MPHLKRTQIYFPERLIDTIKEKARKEHKSMAEIIRIAVKRYLTGEETVDWDNDPVWKIKPGKSTLGNLSEEHDKYLYGRK
jgi:predicted DNA-binding ribbon-helix-helix protein